MKKNNTEAPSIAGKKKSPAKAFVNWTLLGKNGNTIRCKTGFPIYDNELYPNAKEAFLIKLAEEAFEAAKLNTELDAFYKGTMNVEIHLNVPKEELDTSLF